MLKKIDGISDLISEYSGFIIDIWGVIHDGNQLYDGVSNCLIELHKQEKNIVFLTNAPRRAKAAIKVLQQLGISDDLYIGVVSSGEVAFEYASSKRYGEKYFYLGPTKDENILNDSNLKRVSPEQADFILCTGFEYDFQPLEEIIPTLENLASKKLTMLCVNPDIEVVKMDGTRMLCAGAVAEEFEKLGGTTIYIGKPFAEVYNFAVDLFNKSQHDKNREPLKKSEILAIGDSLSHDIKGADSFGLTSVLVTGGLLMDKNDKEIEDFFTKNKDCQPNYLIPRLQL